MVEKNNDKKEVIEIPVGKYFKAIKGNLWIVSTIVLALAVIFLTFRGGMTGNVVSESTAGQNLVSFINAQGNVKAELVSVEKVGQLYQVTVDYNGQEIPVFVSLDGEYLISDPVPLSSDGSDSSGSTDSGQLVDVSVDDDAVLGSKDAPVTIIEFSDYQCPFCRKFWVESFSSLKKDYIDTGKVKFVYRDFPLSSLHPSAEIAAEAAECVREKGGDVAYWKMHDKMFSEQNIIDSGSADGPVGGTAQFTKDDLKKWAKAIGYDIGSCLDSGKYADEVAKDLADGSSAGVTGTPAFIINGLRLDGALPYSQFKQIIDAELAKVQ